MSTSRSFAVRLLGWGCLVVSATGLGAAFAIEYRTEPNIAFVGGENSVSILLCGLLFAAVGAVIVHRLGSHRVGWLFCISGLGWAAHEIGAAYVGYTHFASIGHLPGEQILVWSTTWTPFVFFGAAPALMLFVFPSGKLPKRRFYPFVGIALVAIAGGIVGSAFAPGPFADYPSIENQFGLDGAVGTVMRALSNLGWPLFLVSLIGGVLSLRQRMREGSEVERQQIKWILLAGLLVGSFVLVWGTSFVASGFRPTAVAQWRGVAMGVIPAAVAIAVLKHRLYDVDVIINRTLVYAALSGLLALTYLAAVVLLQPLLAPLTADSDVAIAASTLAMAAMFRPLRARVQTFIDRRFYRRKYDAAETLSEFSSRLRNEVDLDALGRELVGVVGETMEPAHASLWLKGSRE